MREERERKGKKEQTPKAPAAHAIKINISPTQSSRPTPRNPSPLYLPPPLSLAPFRKLESNRHPHDANNDIHALLVAALVLEAPHAVLLVVPVRADGRVHAAAADGHGLAAPRHGRQVLDDGAVDGVLEAGLRGRAAAGFADERFQDRVDYRGVPVGDEGVVVTFCIAERGVAGVSCDLLQSGVCDRWSHYVYIIRENEALLCRGRWSVDNDGGASAVLEIGRAHV